MNRATLPTVGKHFLVLVCLVFTSIAGLAANPVPAIDQPLVPATAFPGVPSFNITVHGTGFVSGAVVRWNNSPRATTFVSASQLTATLTAADVAFAGTSYVSVANPTPGGGTSNSAIFTVRVPTTSVAFTKEKVTIGTKGVNATMTADFNRDGNADIATLSS